MSATSGAILVLARNGIAAAGGECWQGAPTGRGAGKRQPTREGVARGDRLPAGGGWRQLASAACIITGADGRKVAANYHTAVLRRRRNASLAVAADRCRSGRSGMQQEQQEEQRGGRKAHLPLPPVGA